MNGGIIMKIELKSATLLIALVSSLMTTTPALAGNLYVQPSSSLNPSALVDVEASSVQTGVLINSRTFVPFSDMENGIPNATQDALGLADQNKTETYNEGKDNLIPHNAFGLFAARNGLVEYRENNFSIPVRIEDMEGYKFINMTFTPLKWGELSYLDLPRSIDNVVIIKDIDGEVNGIGYSKNPLPVNQNAYNTEVPIYLYGDKFETGLLLNNKSFVSFYSVLNKMNVGFVQDAWNNNYIELNGNDRVFGYITANQRSVGENLFASPVKNLETDYVMIPDKSGGLIKINEKPGLAPK